MFFLQRHYFNFKYSVAEAEMLSNQIKNLTRTSILCVGFKSRSFYITITLLLEFFNYDKKLNAMPIFYYYYYYLYSIFQKSKRHERDGNYGRTQHCHWHISFQRQLLHLLDSARNYDVLRHRVLFGLGENHCVCLKQRSGAIHRKSYSIKGGGILELHILAGQTFWLFEHMV